jgi:GntR family transcriptional regulator
MVMDFNVDAASRTPIYRQLAEQIRSAIARGRLTANARLPSVRELSRRLVINPNTVARVYTELERDGLLVTRHGLGVFVAPPGSDLTKKARKERLMILLDGFFTEAVLLGFSADEVRDLISDRVAQFQWQTGT